MAKANQIEIDFARAKAEIYATVYHDAVALGNGGIPFWDQNIIDLEILSLCFCSRSISLKKSVSLRINIS